MKTFTFPQYEKEWWDIRRSIPTASRFSDIITPAKAEYSKTAYKYACELIGDKFDSDYPRQDQQFQSAAMKNGTILEPEVRDWIEFTTGQAVQQVGFCLTDDGRFGCSPDGLIGDDGGCEIKGPTPKVFVQWALNPEDVPVEHLAQVHGSLIVTGRKWWDFVAYCHGFTPIRIRVEPSEYTDVLREGLEKFYAEYTAILDRIRATLPASTPAPTAEENENHVASMF